jgi:sirohydrochlorin ferrochelatase
MPGLGDILGGAGFIESYLLWNMTGQVVSTLMSPAFTQLLQDAQARHPDVALDPATLADLLARAMVTRADATAEAAMSGMSGDRFDRLADLRKVRVSPADLATGVLRSYVTQADADAQAAPQGYDPEMMRLLADLAGDAPGADQLAAALRRGLIDRYGQGPASTSFQQGIAETRLHDKWAQVIDDLTRAILSPPDAAEAVVRNFVSVSDAEAAAAKSGVSPDLLATLIRLAGDAPGPQQLAEALRRGLIPYEGTGPDATSFLQGIAEGRLADKWAAVIRGLAQLWPTPTDALHAEVEGQITHDQATALYAQLGGDPQFQGWLFDTIGESPTPLEAAMLAARGVIAWDGTGPDVTSYAQAVRESRYRDKWSDAYRHMAEHIPPPSTVIQLAEHQLITRDEAADLLAQNDVRPDIIPLYLGEIDYDLVSDYRGLTESAAVDMYIARLIDRAQATQLLTALHVDPKAAVQLLDYADLRYYIDSINRSVQRIATLYTGRKIGAPAATAALLELGIPAATVDQVLETWTIQARVTVATLTASQIADAWYYGVFDTPTASAELEAIGYTPYDAWAFLSIKNKAPLPDAPPRAVAVPPPAVTPGTT